MLKMSVSLRLAKSSYKPGESQLIFDLLKVEGIIESFLPVMYVTRIFWKFFSKLKLNF